MEERTDFPAARTFVALILAIGVSLAIYRQATIDRSGEFYKPAEVAAIGRGSPVSLTMAADRRFAAGDARGALSLAHRALTLTPADPEALRIFALASGALGNNDLAAQVMSLAGLWGWRDPVVQLWLMNAAGTHDDLTNMLIHADALLRTEGRTNRVLALVAATLSVPGGIDLVAARLADQPDWRPDFFGYVGKFGLNAAPLMIPLADKLRATSPMTADEIAPVVNALVAEHREEAASEIWRRTYAAKSYAPGNAVFDPGFENFATATPLRIAQFDWQLLKTPGLDISVRDAPAKGGKALYVRYSGEEGAPLLRQSIVLKPGAYRLRVSTLRDGAGAPLDWKISCANTKLDLVGRPATESGRWLTDSYAFSVPSGCALQKLEVVGASGKGVADGVTWIDDVSVGS